MQNPKGFIFEGWVKVVQATDSALQAQVARMRPREDPSLRRHGEVRRKIARSEEVLGESSASEPLKRGGSAIGEGPSFFQSTAFAC